MKISKVMLLLVTLFFLTAAVPAVGTSQEMIQDDWQFNAGIYLWGASVGGETGSGSDIQADFSDIFDNLEMAFMGVFGVSKGKWSFLTDVIYLDVEKDTETDLGVALSAKMTSWVVTPTLAYNLVDTERFRLDIQGGARYLYIKPKLELGSRSVAESDSIWDGIVGLKGRVNLGEHFYLPYYGDIGTGDSEYTWQLYGGIGYRFEHVDLVLAYRYLEYSFDDKMVIGNLNFSGPMAGINFRF